LGESALIKLSAAILQVVFEDLA